MTLPHPRWADLCQAFLHHILTNFPWWFDGTDGTATHGWVRFVPDGYRDYPAEECCSCQKNPDGQPVLEANFRLNGRLTFFAHLHCLESLLESKP